MQPLTDKLQRIMNSAARILMLTSKLVHMTPVQGAALAPCVCPCGSWFSHTKPCPARPHSAVSLQFAAVVSAWPRFLLLAQQSALYAQDKGQDIRRQGLSPPSTHSVKLAAPSRSLASSLASFKTKIKTFFYFVKSCK